MPLRLETYREIRALGLSVSRTPEGLHRVNQRGGKEAAAYYAETLEEALSVARQWAAGSPPTPKPKRVVPPPELPAAHVAAAKACLMSATMLLQGFEGGVPNWMRDEVAALARTIQRAGLVLLLGFAALVGWSVPP